MEYISVLVQHHAGPTGNVLIAKNKDGKWEFPQDHIRTNETEEAAAERLCWEILGMKVSVGKLAMRGRHLLQNGITEHIVCGNITHNTGSKDDYHLYYEAVNTWQVEPKSEIYSEFAWVHPSELSDYEFAGDDVNFLAKYDPWIKGNFIPDVRMY